MTFREGQIATLNSLVERVFSLYSNHKTSDRIIINVAGVPGAGKSTVTKAVCDKVNAQLGDNMLIVIPQDGFHYYRKELEAMDNSHEATKRRGAPFTFNSSKLIQLVKHLKYSDEETIYAPDFSHQLKDPTENSIKIIKKTKIILLEGNYVLLDSAEWKELSDLADDKWMVLADSNTIKKRLIQRHLDAGICKDVSESIERVESNDLVNAKYIIDHSSVADYIISN